MNPLKLANPITVTKGAFGLAGTAVGVVDTLARYTVHAVSSGLQRLAPSDRQPDQTEQSPTAGVDIADEDLTEAPTTLPVEPHAPEEPPIDVVGEALAAEAALGNGDVPGGAGFAHEPRGASRDEEHGDAPLQRAEIEGIADEVTAALEGDPEPEEHLTEPVLDEAEAKAIAAEMRTLSRAADPHKD